MRLPCPWRRRAILRKNTEQRASVCFACQNQSVRVQSLLRAIKFPFIYTFVVFRERRGTVCYLFLYAYTYLFLFLFCVFFFKSLFCMSNKTILGHKNWIHRYAVQPHSIRASLYTAGARAVIKNYFLTPFTVERYNYTKTKNI